MTHGQIVDNPSSAIFLLVFIFREVPWVTYRPMDSPDFLGFKPLEPKRHGHPQRWAVHRTGKPPQIANGRSVPLKRGTFRKTPNPYDCLNIHNMDEIPMEHTQMDISSMEHMDEVKRCFWGCAPGINVVRRRGLLSRPGDAAAHRAEPQGVETERSRENFAERVSPGETCSKEMLLFLGRGIS